MEEQNQIVNADLSSGEGEQPEQWTFRQEGGTGARAAWAPGEPGRLIIEHPQAMSGSRWEQRIAAPEAGQLARLSVRFRVEGEGPTPWPGVFLEARGVDDAVLAENEAFPTHPEEARNDFGEMQVCLVVPEGA